MAVAGQGVLVVAVGGTGGCTDMGNMRQSAVLGVMEVGGEGSI